MTMGLCALLRRSRRYDLWRLLRMSCDYRGGPACPDSHSVVTELATRWYRMSSSSPSDFPDRAHVVRGRSPLQRSPWWRWPCPGGSAAVHPTCPSHPACLFSPGCAFALAIGLAWMFTAGPTPWRLGGRFGAGSVLRMRERFTTLEFGYFQTASCADRRPLQADRDRRPHRVPDPAGVHAKSRILST